MGVGFAPNMFHIAPASAYSNLQADTETKVKHYGCHCWSDRVLPDGNDITSKLFPYVQLPLVIQQKAPLRAISGQTSGRPSLSIGADCSSGNIRERICAWQFAPHPTKHCSHLPLNTNIQMPNMSEWKETQLNLRLTDASKPIYCISWSKDVHCDSSGRKFHYFASCGDKKVVIHEIEVDNPRGICREKQTYIDADEDKEFLACVFGGKNEDQWLEE